MAKSNFVPSRQEVIDVFNNSMLYEILYTFGVPDHNRSDYCLWEAINFNRMAHARLLYDFLETSAKDRKYEDDVLAEDFDFPAKAIALPPADRKRLNKDLMHLSYYRSRHTPITKRWPDSILSELHEPVLNFMRHVETQADLFSAEVDLLFWHSLIEDMESGKELIIRGPVSADGKCTYDLSRGHDLPSGKAALTTLIRLQS